MADGKGVDRVLRPLKKGELRTLTGLVSRMQLANAAGLQFSGLRDMYAIFGYEKNIKPEQLLAKYNRQDIASRVVDAPPKATWAHPPAMKEKGALSTKWTAIVKEKGLWGAMYRADRLARLNTFSLLMFGFDDTTKVETSLGEAKELLYVKTLGARQITEIQLNNDTANPRFGMPETYKIKFDDPNDKNPQGGIKLIQTTKEFVVHWSRCVHIVENPLDDTIFGTPIMEQIYNLLDDLLKVAGGTAEMYWLTGNRGLHANIDKEMDIDPADALELSAEIEEYQHQLRRMIRTRGVDLKVLESSIPTPKETFEMLVSLISGTTGIPKRILIGSEAGQLASEQDRANWAERIEERHVLFANPMILDPTITLLQRATLLPEGEVEWIWPSAFIQNPLEKGQTQAQIARSVGNLSRQTGSSTPMQLLSEEECRGVLGFEGTIEDADRYELPNYLEELNAARGGGSDGKKVESDAAKAVRREKKSDQGTADRA